MTIEEVLQIAPYIQRVLADYRAFLRYRDPPNDIIGQCLSTSKNMATVVERLIHRAHPAYSNVEIAIDIGNLGSGMEWLVDDATARFYANNLQYLRNPDAQMRFHAWLSFGGILIDLTVLYTLLDGEDEIHFSPQPFYRDENGICFPDGISLCHRAYRSYDPDEIV